MSKNEQITKEELEKLTHQKLVYFSLFCAYQIKDKWKDIPESVRCIETVEKYLEGEATKEECRDAAAGAYAYASAAYAAAYAYIAANVAANAAHWAIEAADPKDKEKFTKEQRSYYEELLNQDTIVERELLG